MLSEETALSQNSMVIVDWLTSFLKDQNINNVNLKLMNIRDHPIDWDAISNLSELPFVLLSRSSYAVFEFVLKLPTMS